MPKVVDLGDGRVVEFPDGMTDAQIDANLRLSLAGEQGVNRAMAGAMERSTAPSPGNVFTDAAMAGMSGEGGAYADPNATAEDIMGRAASQAAVLGGGSLAGLGVKGALGALAGSAAGNEAGRWVGNRVPVVGGETLANVLGAAGGLVGGGAGAAVAPRMTGAKLLQFIPGGGRGGMLGQLLGAGEGSVAEAAAPKVAKAISPAMEKRLELEARKIAIAEEKLAVMKAREARLSAKAWKVAPEATGTAQAPATAPPSPDATIPAAPAATVAPPRPAAPTTPGVADPRSEFERLVSQLRFIRRTSPEGSKTISEFLKSQPKEVADELRAALAKGYDAPATNLGGHAKLTMPQSKLGYELAKMLGQVQ